MISPIDSAIVLSQQGRPRYNAKDAPGFEKSQHQGKPWPLIYSVYRIELQKDGPPLAYWEATNGWGRPYSGTRRVTELEPYTQPVIPVQDAEKE